jgi:hypothetical protein
MTIYYIVANQLNTDFFCIYLATCLNVQLSLQELANYEVTLIDNKSTVVFLNPATDIVVIKEHSYEIVKPNLL